VEDSVVKESLTTASERKLTRNTCQFADHFVGVNKMVNSGSVRIEELAVAAKAVEILGV
jgi:hypothetical protein